MKEDLMQYVWQHKLWLQSKVTTVDGRRISVINPGQRNPNSGPDFSNASISIDGCLWVGNVEIHVKASDWHRHNHDGNPEYDTVILHVVERDDTIVYRSNGEPIPQMRLPCNENLHKHYNDIVGRSDIDLPCAAFIAEMPTLHTLSWIDNLAYERLYQKTDRINGIMQRLNGDWESTAYITIARALGFGINGDPFERLALSLPLIFIGKHSDSLTSIEALLFGQSGLLDDDRAFGDYVARLRQEYSFLAHKFGLKRPDNILWKMSRMRPANFPHRRIATLAAMLAGGFRMMSRILEVKSFDEAVALFSPQLSPYWSLHCNFNPGGRPTSTALSHGSIAGLAINAIVPLQMTYGLAHGDNKLTDRAVNLYHSLPGEKNTIVSLFERAGLKAKDAFTSQALIQLRREYCEKHKCMDCRIGHRYLASKALKY